MAKSIVSVNYEIPSSGASNVSFSSKLSLLDYDIAIINPDMSSYFSYSESYNGKVSLPDSNSFKLKEQCSHWRREILEAAKADKTVVIMLNELQEVYVATGQVEHSGTGRNARKTRIVELHNNYSIIPLEIKAVNSQGKSIKLFNDNSPLSAYWKEFEKYSQYKIIIQEGIKNPDLITKSGNKVLGGIINSQNSKGKIILLPYINFDKKEFTQIKNDEYFWTEKACQLGKKFVSAVCEIDKNIKNSTEKTPQPSWTDKDKYSLKKEKDLRNDMLRLENQIQECQRKIEGCLKEISEETILKDLLFEKGLPLETAALKALKTLGFKADRYNAKDSEFDAVLECKEGRLICEIEGKDNKPINITKLRQLEMNIDEDFERDDIKEVAKGVLIGNAYRLKDPTKREAFFTEKCLISAERRQTALVRTTDLFITAKYLSENKDLDFAKKMQNKATKNSWIS